VRTKLRVLLVLLVPALAGVGAVTTGAATAARPTCATGTAGRAAAPAGTTNQSVTVDGEIRTYRLTVPKGYRAATPAPLLFDFHGLGSDAQQQAFYSGLETRGAAAGYIVIVPDGSGGAAKRWVPPPLPGTDTDFVQALLTTTEQQLCVDARRVFATGMSSGAVFSTALPCAFPGTFAAIAPVAGVNGHAVCTTGPPVAVAAFHGTADGIVPYAGGRYFSGVRTDLLPEAIRARVAELSAFSARPVTTAVGEWAAFDGCATPPRNTKVAADVTLRSYRRCDAGTAVVLYTVRGGGHTWPGAPAVRTSRLGATTQSIDASALMLRFFAAHAQR
jgi:polyhydroxybutyrate depolymerase